MRIMNGNVCQLAMMQFSDEAEWTKFVEANNDPYGAACVRYAKAWAEQMEMAMADGSTVEKCAKQTSHDTDTEGITGFMYGAAVAALTECWRWGEVLRRWHNKEWGGSEDTEGVLNPALLTIDTTSGNEE